MSKIDKNDVKTVFNILRWSLNSEALVNEILTTVENKSKGFQAEIAKKALTGTTLSEKQTWCVAFEYKKVA